MRPGGITAGALANVAPLDQQRAIEYFGGAAGGASGSLPRPFGLPPCAVVSLSLVALLRALSLPLHSGLVCGLAELGWTIVWLTHSGVKEPALRLTDRLPPEPWSDSLTANSGQRLTVPDSLTALTALSLTV